MAKIIIEEDNTCGCNCVAKCVLGKRGMDSRCTKDELESNGYATQKDRYWKGWNSGFMIAIFSSMVLTAIIMIMKIFLK
jgi:hypothetical protein